MAEMVRLSSDVQAFVDVLKKKEAERGNADLSDARAANWLAREGARAMGLETPAGKKVKP